MSTISVIMEIMFVIAIGTCNFDSLFNLTRAEPSRKDPSKWDLSAWPTRTPITGFAGTMRAPSFNSSVIVR